MQSVSKSRSALPPLRTQPLVTESSSIPTPNNSPHGTTTLVLPGFPHSRSLYLLRSAGSSPLIDRPVSFQQYCLLETHASKRDFNCFQISLRTCRKTPPKKIRPTT